MLSKNYNKLVNIDKLKKEIQNSAITVALDNISALGNNITILFKADIDAGNEALLDALVTAHVYTAPDLEIQSIKFDSSLLTTKKYLRVSPFEPEGESATISSHDWTKPTTWYQGSLEALGIVLANTSGNSFKHANYKWWIDMTHGLCYDEDNIMYFSGNKYKPKIYVDSVLKIESYIDVDDVLVPADYSIDYMTGTVTFTNAVVGVVTANIWYADKSWFIIKPNAGKVLAIKTAEVQFSKDIIINNNSSFVFETWIKHPVSQIMVPLVSLVPSQRPIYYKSVADFMATSNKCYEISNWGGVTNPMIVLPYEYARPKPIKASQDVELRVYVKNHKPIQGEMATATFYVTVDNETV